MELILRASLTTKSLDNSHRFRAIRNCSTWNNFADPPASADNPHPAHFTAEPGKVYDFRTRLLLARNIEYLEMAPVDSDEGALLVARYPWSVSQPKREPRIQATDSSGIVGGAASISSPMQ